MPKFWIWGHYWAYHKYGFEAMAKNDFENLSFSCDVLPSGCNCYYERSDTSVCEMSGIDVLSEMNYEDVRIGLWIGILIIMFFIYRVGFFLMLSKSYKYN